MQQLVYINDTSEYNVLHNKKYDLVTGCIKGERSAQYELYKQYSKAMYNICFRMLKNRADAEDILQEVFSYVFERISTFRFESTIGAWIKRITINKCLNYINKNKIQLQFMDELPDYTDEEQTEIPSFSVEKVKSALERLPDGYRMIFSLYLLEGYDHTEISQILKISQSTSKTLYRKAKHRIKDILINEKKTIDDTIKHQNKNRKTYRQTEVNKKYKYSESI